MTDPIRASRTTYLGFAVFGGFWGTWGASIPAVRDQAGLSDGQLGTALLFVGAGALPAMALAGRAVDRWGSRSTAALLVALGLAGVVVALTARDLVGLCVGLAVLGACSGAVDVGINTAAGAAQQDSGAPVLSRAHAAFSALVVLGSLTTGVLRAAGAPLVVPFALLALGAVSAAVSAWRCEPPTRPVADPTGAGSLAGTSGPGRLLLGLGLLGALAFAVENGHQSWSALYLGDVLAASPSVAAAGPAVFAAVVALTRLLSGPVSTRHPVAVLTVGAGAAASGTLLLAVAPGVGPGLGALALAAAGTAVLLPTLLGVLTARVDDESRGRATSRVTSAAYLGFLAGPVYVGRWSDAVGLPGAMAALAVLALVLALLGPLTLRATSARTSPAAAAPR